MVISFWERRKQKELKEKKYGNKSIWKKMDSVIVRSVKKKSEEC